MRRLGNLALAVGLALAILPALAQERQGSFDRTLKVTGPLDLDVRTHSGRITVRAGEPSVVRIHADIRTHNDHWRSGDIEQRIREIESHPPLEQTGNSIRILPIEDEWLRRRISISYELVVPAETKLRSRTGSGSQTVEGVRGPVDASTGSGSMQVSRIEGEVRAHTGSGRMELDTIRGRVDASTGSGSIQGSGIAGPIVAHTGSGSLRLEQTAAQTVKAHTGSGGVTLRLPSAGGFDLYARTGSGRVYVDQPITVRGNLGGHEIQGKVRGGGPLLDVSTGSGSVRIE